MSHWQIGAKTDQPIKGVHFTDGQTYSLFLGTEVGQGLHVAEFQLFEVNGQMAAALWVRVLVDGNQTWREFPAHFCNFEFVVKAEAQA